MFNPYDEQLENDAASLAAAGTPEPSDTPEYAPERRPDNITGASFPRGKVGIPLGSRYNRVRPVYSDSGISSLSASLATAATRLHSDRLSAQESHQDVTVDNQPAIFISARLSTTVTHKDASLDRSRVEEIFHHHTSRRLAF
jgi:hypothetical protein